MTSREEDKKRIIKTLLVLGIIEAVAEELGSDREDTELTEDTEWHDKRYLFPFPVFKNPLKETTTNSSISNSETDLKTD